MNEANGVTRRARSGLGRFGTTPVCALRTASDMLPLGTSPRSARIAAWLGHRRRPAAGCCVGAGGCCSQRSAAANAVRGVLACAGAVRTPSGLACGRRLPSLMTLPACRVCAGCRGASGLPHCLSEQQQHVARTRERWGGTRPLAARQCRMCPVAYLGMVLVGCVHLHQVGLCRVQVPASGAASASDVARTEAAACCRAAATIPALCRRCVGS